MDDCIITEHDVADEEEGLDLVEALLNARRHTVTFVHCQGDYEFHRRFLQLLCHRLKVTPQRIGGLQGFALGWIVPSLDNLAFVTQHERKLFDTVNVTDYVTYLPRFLRECSDDSNAPTATAAAQSPSAPQDPKPKPYRKTAPYARGGVLSKSMTLMKPRQGVRPMSDRYDVAAAVIQMLHAAMKQKLDRLNVKRENVLSVDVEYSFLDRENRHQFAARVDTNVGGPVAASVDFAKKYFPRAKSGQLHRLAAKLRDRLRAELGYEGWCVYNSGFADSYNTASV